MTTDSPGFLTAGPARPGVSGRGQALTAGPGTPREHAQRRATRPRTTPRRRVQLSTPGGGRALARHALLPPGTGARGPSTGRGRGLPRSPSARGRVPASAPTPGSGAARGDWAVGVTSPRRGSPRLRSWPPPSRRSRSGSGRRAERARARLLNTRARDHCLPRASRRPSPAALRPPRATPARI